MKKVIILVIVSAMSVFTTMAQTSVKYNGEINAGYSIGVGSYPVNRVNLNTIQGTSSRPEGRRDQYRLYLFFASGF